MSNTRGLHWIVTTHGTWMHGDPRGSWYEGRLIGPDPFLQQARVAKLAADAVVLDEAEQSLVAQALGDVIVDQGVLIHAATIHATHAHLVIAPLHTAVDTFIATLKYRSARRVNQHRRTAGIATSRSVWTEGRFVRYLFDDEHLHNAIEYVREHNRRVGRPDDPYPWVGRADR
jgi:REP element-mobilizing transposase RayT